MDEKLNWETQLQHADPIDVAADNFPLVPPIFQSVKYHNPDLDSFSGKNGPRYFYARMGNPTVMHLEKMLARLQGCESGIALGSGIAAISATLLALLQAGDHVIYFAESYGPTRAIIRDFLRHLGIQSTMLVMADVIQDASVYERAIQSGKTRAVIFESPTNPITRIAPIAEIVRVSQAHDVTTVLDATLAGLHQNRNVGIDLYIHSLTKFAGGHGDVMGGAIFGAKKLIDKIRGVHMMLGAVLDPHAASLILRGMKTYAIRFREESARALDLAKRLENHPLITRVFYPGLESHPDFSRLKKLNMVATPLMKDHGSVVAFEFKSVGDVKRDRARIAELIRGLELACLAPSLGSTETLVTPVRSHFAGDLTPVLMGQALVTETTLRVSVGLEDVEDMWAQWSAALAGADKI